MGLTRDYLKFAPSGLCNLVGSPNGAVQFVDALTCAVIAVDRVVFYNMRTLEKCAQIIRNGKTVSSFKLSPDKSLIAIGYCDGEIHVYQRGENVARSVFAGHRTGVNCLAFSSDGFILASGGQDSTVVVWDLVNESGICRLVGHKSTITQLQFAQRDRFLVSSSKDTQLKFWSMASKSCFYTLASSASEVYTFALVDEDRLLVIGNADIELMVFELRWEGQDGDLDDDYYGEENGGNEAKRLRAQPCKPLVGFIEEEKDSDQEEEQATKILRCNKRGALIRQAKGRALQLSVSSDESIICCVSSDSLMDVYRHFTGEESQKRYQKKLRKLRQRAVVEQQGQEGEHLTEKMETEVSGDVTTLITRIGDFRADSKIKWVVLCDGFAELENKKVREFRLFCLLKSNDVQGVALRVEWKSNATSTAPLISLGQRSHRSDVRALAIASDASFFVTGSQESAIVWNMGTLSAVNKLCEDGLSQITASMLVAGDKQLILGTRLGSIFLFDLLSCELLEKHEKSHGAAISSICAFPSKDGFLSSGYDKQARFWHFEAFNEIDGRKRLTLKCRRTLELPDEALCASISPNAKYVAFGLLDNTARVYFMDSLKFFVSLYGHSLPVYSIDISADSKLVVTGSGDKTAKIWGLDFGDCHKSLHAHDDTVTCVQFSKETTSEERLFWSAGKDGKLKQWDADKFHRVQTLEGHTDQVDAIALSGDGRILISASRDKSVRLWELTDEIIVLQEEEEREREKEYEQRLIDEEDIIAGERREAIEEGIAPLKSIETVKSTESIMEALDIVRKERARREQAEQMGERQDKVHPMLMKYQQGAEHRFVLDIVHKIRHSHLEKSLLTLSFSYVPDLLREAGKCVRCNYKAEIAARVILFLIKIHHNQIVHSVELLPLIDELRTALPKQVNDSLSRVGFNIAALRFLQMQLEERQNERALFSVQKAEQAKAIKQKRQRRKVKEVAFVRSGPG